MMNINLLPSDYLQKRELTSYLKTTAAFQAVIFLLFVLIVIILKLTIGIIESFSANYDEILRDQSFAQEDLVAGKLNVKRAEWEKLHYILDTLEQDENINSMAISVLVNSLPEGMYLRNMRVESNGVITVNAVSPRMKSASDYLERLDRYFRCCSLVSMSAGEDGVEIDLLIEQ